MYKSRRRAITFDFHGYSSSSAVLSCTRKISSWIPKSRSRLHETISRVAIPHIAHDAACKAESIYIIEQASLSNAQLTSFWSITPPPPPKKTTKKQQHVTLPRKVSLPGRSFPLGSWYACTVWTRFGSRWFRDLCSFSSPIHFRFGHISIRLGNGRKTIDGPGPYKAA